MTQARDYRLTFTWVPAGPPDQVRGLKAHDKPRKTVVNATASSWPLAVQVALRAIALDKSIPTPTRRSGASSCEGVSVEVL